MRWRCVALVVTGLLMGADKEEQRREKDDVKALQGTWLLKTVEWCGEKTAQDLDEVEIRYIMLSGPPEKRYLRPKVKLYQTTLEIKGRKFIFRSPIHEMNGGRRKVREARGGFDLDVRKQPTVMKLKETEVAYEYDDEKGAERREGYDMGATSCIYLLKGDTLQWCAKGTGKKLPAKFATDHDEDVFLLTFRRIKK